MKRYSRSCLHTYQKSTIESNAAAVQSFRRTLIEFLPVVLHTKRTNINLAFKQIQAPTQIRRSETTNGSGVATISLPGNSNTSFRGDFNVSFRIRCGNSVQSSIKCVLWQVTERRFVSRIMNIGWHNRIHGMQITVMMRQFNSGNIRQLWQLANTQKKPRLSVDTVTPKLGLIHFFQISFSCHTIGAP